MHTIAEAFEVIEFLYNHPQYDDIQKKVMFALEHA